MPTVVEGAFAAVVDGAWLTGVAAAGRRAAGLVVEVTRGRVVVVGSVVVDVGAVVDELDTDVSTAGVRLGAMVPGTVPEADASCERRIVGVEGRVGTPAMATPTAAHRTSDSTMIVRWPGLTRPTVRATACQHGDSRQCVLAAGVVGVVGKRTYVSAREALL